MLLSVETLCIARTTIIANEFKDLAGWLITRTWKVEGKPTNSGKFYHKYLESIRKLLK